MNDLHNPTSSTDEHAHWDRAERDQAIFIAQNTTPEQRMQWLEHMLELLKDYLPRRDGPLPDDDECARNHFAARSVGTSHQPS